MDISLEWTGSLTPGSFAKRIAALPVVIDRTLGDRGDVIGAEIVESAKREVPVDTGTLKASIDYSTERDGVGVVTVFIGSDVEYSIFVEFGTRYMGAQPYIRPAIRENKPALETELEDAITEAFTDV